MMIPTGIQFLRAFTMPRALMRMLNLNYSAWQNRVKSGRSPWSPAIDFNSIPMPENQPERPRPSAERYLRPTFGADPTAPQIVALAARLGAGQQSPRKYAENAFEFAKNEVKLMLEWPRGGSIGALRAGCGMCLHKMSLLVALLRANGIPARYRMDAVQIVREIYDLQGVAQDPLGRAVYDSLGFVFGHGCVELLLDDEWLAADVTWDEDLEVGMDIPISSLGMDPDGVWFFGVPGMSTRMEGLPVSLDIFGPLFPAMYRGMMDIANGRFEEARKMGRERLARIGREQYIELKKKFYVPVLPPKREE